VQFGGIGGPETGAVLAAGKADVVGCRDMVSLFSAAASNRTARWASSEIVGGMNVAAGTVSLLWMIDFYKTV
jgi:hypothetical protein